MESLVGQVAIHPDQLKVRYKLFVRVEEWLFEKQVHKDNQTIVFMGQMGESLESKSRRSLE